MGEADVIWGKNVTRAKRKNKKSKKERVKKKAKGKIQVEGVKSM
jgi:hypothetical protein